MELQFSTALAAQLSGATERKLGTWDRSGLLKPSGRTATGSGSRRKYTFQDVVALKTIAGLREQGLSLQRIRRAVKHLRAYFARHDPRETNSQILARLLLVTDGQRVYIGTNRDELMDVESRQTAWSTIAVGRLILQIQDDMNRLDREYAHEFAHLGKTYHLVITPDPETGVYTSQCRELPGAIEQGDTIPEAVENGMDAVESVVEFMVKRRQRTAAPNARTG